MNYAFEKYYHTAALFGTPKQVQEKIDSFSDVGVNELACLIDFGASLREVQESLELLSKLR